jgi:hypothetical protein
VVYVLLSIGGLLLAAACAWGLTGRSRGPLSVAALAFPIALMLVQTVRHDARAIDRNFGLTPVEAEIAPPLNWPAYRNDRLLLAIRRLVPADASLSFLPGGRWSGGRTPAEARRIYVQTGWVRWVAFVIAPRTVVAGPGAPWAVLVDQAPTEAGIRPRHAWRYGHDWLVER